jgi:hypothetical protein
MEQGDEQEDDEQGDEKEEDSLKETDLPSPQTSTQQKQKKCQLISKAMSKKTMSALKTQLTLLVA